MGAADIDATGRDQDESKKILVPTTSWQVHTRILSRSLDPAARPLVLVTGLGMSGRDMLPLARALMHVFRIYIPDNVGFGESSKPERALDVPELGQALAEWMRTADLKGTGIFANSLGCQIAVELALQAPERVARMVLQGPTTDPAARSVLGQIGRWLRNGAYEPFTGKAMAADYRSAGLGRVAATFRHMLRHRIEDRLPEVRAPVLVVRGGRDPICTQAWAEQVARLLPQGELIVVPQAAHSIHRFATAMVDTAGARRALLDQVQRRRLICCRAGLCR